MRSATSLGAARPADSGALLGAVPAAPRPELLNSQPLRSVASAGPSHSLVRRAVRLAQYTPPVSARMTASNDPSYAQEEALCRAGRGRSRRLRASGTTARPTSRERATPDPLAMPLHVFFRQSAIRLLRLGPRSGEVAETKEREAMHFFISPAGPDIGFLIFSAFCV